MPPQPQLTIGDPAPWFILPSLVQRMPHLDTIVGGYRAILFFFGSAKNPQVLAVLKALAQAQPQFQQAGVKVFAIGIDPNDQPIEAQFPNSDNFKLLWDFGGELSIQYGVCHLDRQTQAVSYDPTTFVLDENLRILHLLPLETHINHVEQLLTQIQALPIAPPAQIIAQHPPVLLIPNVLSIELCQHLIQLYEADGGQESGFMEQVDQQTRVMLNPKVKRRRDLLLTDSNLLGLINSLIGRRVQPEIFKAFQFKVTQFERYVVACYEASNQGFFHAHRDNRSIGTAHRRFAMTVNLNSGYEGGCLRFPEYSQDLYSPPPGGAIVFSCSLLHEATPVTQGRRFALLSFLFDDQDAKLRQQTQGQIVRETPPSSPTAPPASQPIANQPPDRSPKSSAIGFQSQASTQKKRGG